MILILSIVIFISAEIIAEISQLWLVNNPSVSSLTTYNRTLSNIPQALSTGASVFLTFGLPYYSRRRINSIIAVGLVLLILSFVLNFLNILSSTIEYYPGYYWTIPSGPLSNLFAIGLGTVIAAIMSFLLRDMLIGKTSAKA